MTVPVRQALAVGRYIIAQKLKRRRRYPLVLMLEPLFRCNLACAGCGKIQYPEEILRKTLSPEECFRAAEECGAPVVSIAGGEPLIHKQIDEIVAGLIERKRFIYLCSNAILLQRKIDLFKPSPYLIFNIHLDGLEKVHDGSVQHAGVYHAAVAAIRELKQHGFRVTTNTTVFNGHSSRELQDFFDEMTKLAVDGMTISPGYRYEKAPDQDRFLQRAQTTAFFKDVLEPVKRRKWKFNHSPLYLDFLKGERDYACTPWGNPSYSVLGWQRPCYLFSEGSHAKTFEELMQTTDWEAFGPGRHSACDNCMAHCGFEPTAVEDSMSSVASLYQTIRRL